MYSIYNKSDGGPSEIQRMHETAKATQPITTAYNLYTMTVTTHVPTIMVQTVELF